MAKKALENILKLTNNKRHENENEIQFSHIKYQVSKTERMFDASESLVT